jgi:FecR protein
MRIASFSRFAGTLLLSGAASLLWAQGPPPQGEPPNGAPPDTGIDQTVARVSYVEGSVSYARGDDPDQWQGLDPNVPMTIGDRVYTDQAGTIELELAHGGRVEVGPQTDLTAVNMTDQVQQFAVNSGVSSFAVRRLAPGTVFEVDTPNAAVTFDQNGLYRVDVDASGQTRLTVHKGNATIASGGGQLGVSSGEAIEIQGTDNPRYDVVAPTPPDRWDSFVDSRVHAARGPTSPSTHYVSAAVVGAGDLDRYGTWQSVPGYGNVWAPSGVPAGWAPYRAGHWYWQDPWGWTWISTEPWGWAPYHYGRWAVVSNRWFWVPVAPAVRTVAYAPALVAFVGGPPGVGVAVTGGAVGFVGWFPLAPRDPLIPWWGVRPAVNVHVTNVTYVNRTQVTVVQQTTFVTGAAVSGAVIRDEATVRQLAAAPVVVGRVPVLPTTASIRIASRQAAAPAPPAAIASRTVVTRSAPPPAPPTFQQKLAVIQENKAPVANRAVAPAAATGARTIVASKPAASTSGSVQLAPRAASAQNTRRVEPVSSGPPRPVSASASASAGKPVAAPASVNAPSNVERTERGTAPPPHAAPPRVPPPTRAAPPAEPAGEPKEKHEAAAPHHGGPPAKASPAPHGKSGERKPHEQPHRPTPKPE